MAFTTDPQTTAPATVAAKQYTQAITCDLDLQSLLDAVTTLMGLIAATGLGDVRKVSLAFSVVLVSLTPTSLKITATWTV